MTVNLSRRAAKLLARCGSVVSIALLALFVAGSFGNKNLPNLTEAVGLLLFPGGIVAGMVIGWRKEFVGGCITLVSLLAFYVWCTFFGGGFPTGPYFFLFSLPGLFFLAAGTSFGASTLDGAE
ncbi:hypothetical protein SV7mr_39180 [Stieleria bergensis]|uniref:DUF7670 domain-containing protein n=1 Tax=Stieleria bergensis TaxID=2528025 RepID=A0A517SZ81_9BACT|nr:hypothetical protein SV7mr_39180 [Planctomycetes bacterium SV_7m_r]